MVETQMIAFVALAGLMGHALYVITNGGGDAPSSEANNEPSLFWTSERLNQSGDGQDRPFFLE